MMDKEMIELRLRKLIMIACTSRVQKKFMRLFHANARITGYLLEILWICVDQFADFGFQQPFRQKTVEKVWNITSCKITETTAAVMLKKHLGIKSVDTLLFKSRQ